MLHLAANGTNSPSRRIKNQSLESELIIAMRHKREGGRSRTQRVSIVQPLSSRSQSQQDVSSEIPVASKYEPVDVIGFLIMSSQIESNFIYIALFIRRKHIIYMINNTIGSHSDSQMSTDLL